MYYFKLAQWQYDEGILDKSFFLSWMISEFKS